MADDVTKILVACVIVVLCAIFVPLQKSFAYECQESLIQSTFQRATREDIGRLTASLNGTITSFTHLGSGAFLLCLDDKRTVVAYGYGERDEERVAESTAQAPALTNQLDELAAIVFNDTDILGTICKQTQ